MAGGDNIKEGAKTESGQNRKEVMSAEMRSFLVLRIGQQVNETIIEDGSYVKGKTVSGNICMAIFGNATPVATPVPIKINIRK